VRVTERDDRCGAMHAEPAPRKTPERQLDSFTAGPAFSQLTVQEELAEQARQLGHEHQRFAHQPPVHPVLTRQRPGRQAPTPRITPDLFERASQTAADTEQVVLRSRRWLSRLIQ
jgi:hypothetical protein